MLQPSLHAYLGSCLCPCPELRSECLREKRGTLPPLRSELCTNTYHVCFSFKTNFLGRPVPPALQSRKQMQQASCAALTSEVLSPNCQGSSGRTRTHLSLSSTSFSDGTRNHTCTMGVHCQPRRETQAVKAQNYKGALS